MTWSGQRQLFYVAIIALFFLSLGFLIGYPYFNKPPTCNDRRQNGDETGPDCGGSCPLACASQVSAISVLWSRAFEVIPGRYNAVAYLVNHNKNAAVENISYRFRFADKDNLYIGKREGVAFVPPGGKFAIFEPAVDTGSSIPVYTTFEFTEIPVWKQVSQEKIDQLKVLVSDITLIGQATSPHLSATISNNSLFTIPNVNAVAILYDATGNAVSVSSTYLSQLQGGQSQNVNFTWPQPFTSTVIAEEIIPMYNIFSVKLP
jgi:hypothetical protein